MKCIEYGSSHHDVIILLHGGGLSWWNYRDAAQLLAADYHVVLPVISGHASSDAPFTTIEHCAADLIRMIDERFGGQVLLIGGLSLGGQVLLEMLSQRGDICRHALIESASVVPSRLTAALIPSTFGSCYGLISRRWFARLQSRSLRIRPDLFEDYYRDTCAISKSDMIAFLRASTLYALKPAAARCAAQAHVFVGAKERPAMRRSARLIRSALPCCTLRQLPKLRHGEFSLNHPNQYADTIMRILDTK